MTGRRGFFKSLTAFLTGGILGKTKTGQPAHAEEAPAPSSGSSASANRTHLLLGAIRDDFDLIVVGGGIAGTSAAIAAARNGMRVALVHNRSMLGGNSSSEVKLFPEDNSGHAPWIKEGGIHEEFHTEERVRNHYPYREGTMNCHWDLVLYEKVLMEKNLRLFLNSNAFAVTMKDPSRIGSVQALQVGTEKLFDLSAPLFVDASGDGVLAHLAGADYRWGREARSEYNEPLAPETADEKVMGNTLFFRAVDTGRPIPFKNPDWAATFETEEDLTSRGHSYIEGGYWWIEVGAPFHPITDNEEIRSEGLRQLLGVWDHIKNKGDHGAENYGLEFVGFWPYKRECRRILGDFVLTQDHVQDPKPLFDSVAYGCWGIDIHVQGGILNRKVEPYPPPGRDGNWESYGSGIYGIPLRSLYSRNIENLMMAGRPISGSYVAFASSRVLSTGSIVGQAVGTAAAVCKKRNLPPKAVAKDHAFEVQQTILRQDGHILGVANEDPNDLARSATVTASSESKLEFPDPDSSRELVMPHAQLFPVSLDRIEEVQLFLWSELKSDTEIRIGLRPAPSVWDFRSTLDIAEARGAVPANKESWVKFLFNVEVDSERLYYVYTEKVPGIRWKAFSHQAETPSVVPVGTTPANLPGATRWRTLNQGHALCLRVLPESMPYSPKNIIKGTNRPDAWTNAWISDPAQGLPAWFQLSWDTPQTFNTFQMTFDTNALRRETAALFRYPDCVKDYTIEAKVGESWKEIAKVTDNYVRRRVHRFDRISADAVRVNILATNGAAMARVYEARVYDE
jgi:hypothetical protein